ncbi:MAG: hypothetical protein HC849_23145 [Oscillatoriales cyanobacterium RU_3_3]|nr:hypothetical protein [Oscillatoriales cyanobacterium RU_3_3]
MNEEQNLKSLSQSDIQVYLQFLIEVLQATRNSNGDAQVVYLLLAANTDKTNLILAEILPRFVSAVLRKVPTGTVQSLVADIVTFSDLIQQFPLGNKASNMEVAMLG